MGGVVSHNTLQWPRHGALFSSQVHQGETRGVASMSEETFLEVWFTWNASKNV